jgi:hypothetical protein
MGRVCNLCGSAKLMHLMWVDHQQDPIDYAYGETAGTGTSCESCGKECVAITQEEYNARVSDNVTRCKECGGTNVQAAFWVDPNTHEVFDGFGTWNSGDNTWCADCDDNTDLT